MDPDEPCEDSSRLPTEASLPNPDLEALHRRVEEQAAELDRLNDMLVSKEDECAQLARQNQDLFEKLAEMQYNYELVSTMYDDMVAQNGAAKLIERKKMLQSRRFQLVLLTQHWPKQRSGCADIKSRYPFFSACKSLYFVCDGPKQVLTER